MSQLHAHHLVGVTTILFASPNAVWLEGSSRRSFYVKDPSELLNYAFGKGIGATGNYIPSFPEDVVDSYRNAYPHAFEVDEQEDFIPLPSMPTQHELRVSWALRTVKQMRTLLRRCDMPVSGVKAALCDRLAAAHMDPQHHTDLSY